VGLRNAISHATEIMRSGLVFLFHLLAQLLLWLFERALVIAGRIRDWALYREARE
jgi:hypothetical protein